jgi:hypothetical protein
MRAKSGFIVMVGLVFFFALGLCAPAQTAEQGQQVIKEVVQAQSHTGASTITMRHVDGQGATLTFVTSEMGFESKVVKGVPFTADTQTEFAQTLSNGQKIYRKSVTALARDSEGRTRREQTIDAVGLYGGTPHQTIFINDPVAGVNYVLDPANRVATKTFIASLTWIGEIGAGAETVHVTSDRSVGATTARKTIVMDGINTGAGKVVASTTTTISHPEHSRTESLGTMTIEGITVEGTRSIETIPAGSIGNDTPIEIISEKWYSPELGMVVKSTRVDPMAGDNTYQLLNIRRAEPPASLFQVPSDYTIKEGSQVHIQTIKK